MKRIAYLWLSAAILAGLLVAMAAAQDQTDNLADYARQVKKEQPGPAAKKVYDNDNLPKDEQISVVGTPAPAPVAEGERKPTETTEASTPETPAKNADQPNDGGEAQPGADGKVKIAIEPGQSPEERQRAYAEWQQKIAGQKQAVDLIQRELDVLQREYRMRAAAVYADVGYRLRNAGQWDKEDAQYKQQIEAKQKALNAAKQQLADLQEQARKAGVPPKLRE